MTAVLALSACATAPEVYDFDNSKTVSTSYDQTWEKVITYFSSNNIPIKTLEKDSGLVVAEIARLDGRSISRYADCQASMLDMIEGGKADYNVFVRRAADGTTVTVNTDFSATRRGVGTATSSFSDCNSKGVFEQEFLSQF